MLSITHIYTIKTIDDSNSEQTVEQNIKNHWSEASVARQAIQIRPSPE